MSFVPLSSRPLGASDPRPEWVELAGWLVIAVLVGVAITMVSSSPFPDTSAGLFAWSLLLCVTAISPIVAVPKGRRLSDLGVLFALAWSLTFGVASLAWLGQDLVHSNLVWVSVPDIERAIALCTLGIAMFWVGYLPMLHARSRTKTVADRTIRWGRVYAVAAIGLMASYGLYRSGLLGYSLAHSSETNVTTTSAGTTALVLLAPGLTFGFLAAWVEHLRGSSRRSKRAVIVLGGMSALIAVASGNKSPILYLTIGMGLIYLALRGRIPKRLIVVGLVAFVALIPGVELFRQSVAPRASTTQSYLGISTLQSIGRGLTGGSTQTMRDWLETRPQSADQVALIIDQTPSLFPFRYGSLWALAPVYNVIPRAVWPSKPSLDLETQFDHTYGHLPPSVLSNTGLTYPGDLFANFGIPGVVLGMALLGVFFACLTRRLRRADRPWWLILFAITVVTVWQPDHSVTSVLLLLPRQLLVGAGMVLWMFPKAHDRPPAAASLLAM